MKKFAHSTAFSQKNAQNAQDTSVFEFLASALISDSVPQEKAAPSPSDDFEAKILAKTPKNGKNAQNLVDTEVKNPQNRGFLQMPDGKIRKNTQKSLISEFDDVKNRAKSVKENLLASPKNGKSGGDYFAPPPCYVP